MSGTAEHPQILSAALIERDGAALAVHRKGARGPFGGQWLLPMTPVLPSETAEDAAGRHAREQFGVEVTGASFADTVYIDDPDDGAKYVANIFRCALGAGAMRFRADGDYDDARWLRVEELQQLWMPPALRDSVVRIVSDPDFSPGTAWNSESPPAGEGMPLAERAVETVPPPDNRAGWNKIARAYQEERYGDRFGERLMWSWRASEDDLHLLGEGVQRKRALVLGCGGGQDVVALAKMGAVAVGIDSSVEQLTYAKRHATKHAADNAAFAQADVRDLARFDDESFDLAISIHALDYVDDVKTALEEASRVLKPGSTLAIAVKHPYDVRIEGEAGAPPYRVWTSYWTHEHDEEWAFKGSKATFRRYFRTMSEWCDAVIGAGFTIERIIEPKEDALPKAPGDTLDDRWMALMPYTMIIKARKA